MQILFMNIFKRFTVFIIDRFISLTSGYLVMTFQQWKTEIT